MFDGKLLELLPLCGVFGVGGLDFDINKQYVICIFGFVSCAPMKFSIYNLYLLFVVHSERWLPVCQHEQQLPPPNVVQQMGDVVMRQMDPFLVLVVLNIGNRNKDDMDKVS